MEGAETAHKYNDNKFSILFFSILASGRTSFHLSALEATYIKTSKPNMCKQKEFVYGLKQGYSTGGPRSQSGLFEC